ncbi:heptaprenyl diphosphate synthase component 1 [Rossellomorea marisflavi]|uniref:heptaprenyl diphosphate synthase component 1 n=1 Tax=Rossellomorea marisflavi TaxID=189381 RepID=UPI003D2F3A30
MKFIDCNHQANIIHQYVEEQLHHSYLKEYIDHPYIDRDRIHFLLLPFAEADGDISLEEVQWISTAMLLQIALDTHEKVTNSEFDPLKERQLTVLAGVYFSSLYYKILAETDEVDLIAILAKAIKEVNESKISIYKGDHADITALMKTLKKREASIISNFFAFMDDSRWEEVVSDVLVYKRLIQERSSLEETETTTFLQALAKVSLPSALRESGLLKKKSEGHRHLLSSLDRLIEGVKAAVHRNMEDGGLVAPNLKKIVLELLPYAEPREMTKLYAEEG